MRYVLYAAMALVAVSVWFNNSHHGNRIKRQMNEHPAESAQLYGS